METDILLVSDLPAGLEEIIRILKELAGERPVRVIFDQEQALEIIDAEKNELVFCYLQAGALASTFFLNDVWKRNPRGGRFLLDSAADPAVLVRCVLGAHHFIQTPLDSVKVRAAVNQAEETKRFVRNEKIQALVSRMRTLPGKPSVYTEVIREIRSENASADAVAALVSKDLSVSTKLIQLANSGFFGLAQPVADIREAVLHLGLETTASVVVSLEAFAKFDKVKPLWFSVEKVWKHSQIVAELARQIAERFSTDPQLRSQTYLAALLHDVGQLTFAENFGDEYANAAKSAEQQGRPLFEVEYELYRATHADTGAYLLALWGLPLPIVEAVANQHAAPGTVGTTFTPAVALNLAERLMSAEAPVEKTLPLYPPELGLREEISFIKCAFSALNPQPAATAPSQKSEPRAKIANPPAQTQPPKTGLSRLFGSLRHRATS